MYLFLSILLFSCSGNGNKSEKNNELIDMDSTEYVVIDTMVTSPIESKEKAEESTRVKSKDPIVVKPTTFPVVCDLMLYNAMINTSYKIIVSS